MKNYRDTRPAPPGAQPWQRRALLLLIGALLLAGIGATVLPPPPTLTAAFVRETP